MNRYFSIILTFLVLLSSSGIGYAQHFCGGHEVASDIVLGSKALSCGMPMEKDGCCDNEKLEVETDENFSIVKVDLDFNSDFEIEFVSFEKPYGFNLFTYKLQNKYFIDRGPPPLGNDLHILYQRFLI